MSIAEQTREAVRTHPFLYDALRAGVVNYTEAARFLDVGDEDAVAAALRRYAAELDPPAQDDGDARVRMESGFGVVDDGKGPLTVGEVTFEPGVGSLTAIIATGDVSTSGLRRVLGRCETAAIEMEAVGYTGAALVLVVQRREGPNVLRIVESVF